MQEKSISANRNTPNIPVPLYSLVRDRILLQLYQLPLPPGSLFSTEQRLCQHFQVSRNTIRHAINELEKAGYLKRRQKIGIQIAQRELPPPKQHGKGQKVLLLLPSWNFNAGNFYDYHVLRHLNSQTSQPFHVEMRLPHDGLKDDPKNLAAVIAVDPPLEQIPTLEKLSEVGVKIITVEPRTNLYLSTNLQFDIKPAAWNVVNYLFSKGHKRIGLLKQSGYHITYQQWFDGFVMAMADHDLPVYPQTILQNNRLEEIKDHSFRQTSAWICSSLGDQITLMERLQKMHLRIPEDVSVVASDDPYPHALTVCRPDYDKLSEMLLKLLNNPQKLSPGSVLFCPMKLILRNSVAPLAHENMQNSPEKTTGQAGKFST